MVSVAITKDSDGNIEDVAYGVNSSQDGIFIQNLVQPEFTSDREYRMVLSGDIPLWQSRESSTSLWQDEKAVWELQKRAIVKPDLEEEYEKSINRGFQFDGGTFIPTPSRRQRLAELVNQVNAARNGDVRDPLPNGRTTVRFTDASGTTHDFNSNQIIKLGAKGNDMFQKAEDNLELLNEKIVKATTKQELESIDTKSGWPN